MSLLIVFWRALPNGEKAVINIKGDVYIVSFPNEYMEGVFLVLLLNPYHSNLKDANSLNLESFFSLYLVHY